MHATYKELETELEAIIEWFGSADADIDEAAVKYERGLELITLLKKQLLATENTVTKLKAKFDTLA